MSEELLPLCLDIPRKCSWPKTEYPENFLVSLSPFGEILERYLQKSYHCFLQYSYPFIILSNSPTGSYAV
jgi:hypothetical protein